MPLDNTERNPFFLLPEPPPGLVDCDLSKMDYFRPLPSLVRNFDDLPLKTREMARLLYDYACRATPGASIPAGNWRKLARIMDTTQPAAKWHWPVIARVLDLTECTDGQTYAWVAVPVVSPLWESHLEKSRQGTNGANRRWGKTYSSARARPEMTPDMTPDIDPLNREKPYVFREGSIATATTKVDVSSSRETSTESPLTPHGGEAAAAQGAPWEGAPNAAPSDESTRDPPNPQPAEQQQRHDESQPSPATPAPPDDVGAAPMREAVPPRPAVPPPIRYGEPPPLPVEQPGESERSWRRRMDHWRAVMRRDLPEGTPPPVEYVAGARARPPSDIAAVLRRIAEARAAQPDIFASAAP